MKLIKKRLLFKIYKIRTLNFLNFKWYLAPKK
jgi:hypothetical protein